MKNKFCTFVIIVLASVAPVTAAYAQFKIERGTFSSGSADASNGRFRLRSTAGQTLAGISGNSENRVFGGFWYQLPPAIPTTINETPEPVPADYRLEQNYPNPFNPTTTIRFALPVAGKASLTVFNLLGQRVLTLLDKELEAGEHEILLNALMLPSGVYIYRLQADNYSDVKRLTLLK